MPFLRNFFSPSIAAGHTSIDDIAEAFGMEDVIRYRTEDRNRKAARAELISFIQLSREELANAALQIRFDGSKDTAGDIMIDLWKEFIDMCNVKYGRVAVREALDKLRLSPHQI